MFACAYLKARAGARPLIARIYIIYLYLLSKYKYIIIFERYRPAHERPSISFITNCITNYNNTVKCGIKNCMRKKRIKELSPVLPVTAHTIDSSFLARISNERFNISNSNELISQLFNTFGTLKNNNYHRLHL